MIFPAGFMMLLKKVNLREFFFHPPLRYSYKLYTQKGPRN
ncbi:hypothetical protein HMPREF3213_03567 [Heyndrickxia coagulans]|uniref:Uncharacterized protein n=1 Tax=Heyndrickxia coagulans TaxID=1398 RepID=A0A133KBZ2_HEYCO|nr:hypothetical protein HMPREF3213_03567 [Heyndrickxia coagulans]